MFQGQLEYGHPPGVFGGWAFETAFPARPLALAILGPGGGELASGLAHLCREDLVARRRATGWCAFRLLSPTELAADAPGPFYLVAAQAHRVIHSLERLGPSRAEGPAISGLKDALALEAPWQLDACGEILDDFVRRRGAELFVRRAHIYALGRFAEVAEVERGRRALDSAASTPLEILLALTSSGEAAANRRPLAAPNAPAFPFV